MKFKIIFFLCSLICSFCFCRAVNIELIISKDLASFFEYNLEIKRNKSNRKFSITKGSKKITNQESFLCTGIDGIYGNKKYYMITYDIPYSVKNRWGNGNKLETIDFSGFYTEDWIEVKNKNKGSFLDSHGLTCSFRGDEVKNNKKFLIITIDYLKENLIFAVNWSCKSARGVLTEVFNDMSNFTSEEKEGINQDLVENFIQQTIY